MIICLQIISSIYSHGLIQRFRDFFLLCVQNFAHHRFSVCERQFPLVQFLRYIREIICSRPRTVKRQCPQNIFEFSLSSSAKKRLTTCSLRRKKKSSRGTGAFKKRLQRICSDLQARSTNRLPGPCTGNCISPQKRRKARNRHGGLLAFGRKCRSKNGSLARLTGNRILW